MKNFFKKLAFVLALAMVVTAIAPAAKASAATEPTLKYSGKVLYVGGDKTGTYGDTYRFKFNNASGYTATWKSSKTSVATVDAKTGEIQAVAVGKTVITATLKKGKTTVELKANVTVKQNAEKIGFGSTASVKDMAVGDTGKVNVYRQVGTTKVWKQADKTVTTDVVKWTTSDATVATVDKWGKVTAMAAGEATITATATQSEGSKAVVSKSYKVTVAAGLTSAKQASIKTIEAKFAGDLSAVVNKDNLIVSQVVGATKVKVIVSDIKFDDTDKTKATITVYNKFTKDAEYVVEYKDTKASFKGADDSAEAVASVKITTTEAQPNESKKIEVKLFDKNGVDITTDELLTRVTFSIVGTNNDAIIEANGKSIVFFNKDKSATVKASYNTYTYNEGTPVTYDTEAVIVCKEDTTTVVAVGVATIATSNPDFTNATTKMSVKDQTSKIFIKTNKTDADKTAVTSMDDTNIKFSSADPLTMIVLEDGSLYPIKEGTCAVIVKYGDVVIGQVVVTIGGERKVLTVNPTWDRTATLSKGVADDTLTLTIEAKDQFGSPIATVPEVSFATGAATITSFDQKATGDNGKTEVVFTGSDYTTKGNYQFKVKVGDITRYVTFTVGDAEGKTASYALTNTNKTVDTALKRYDETSEQTKKDTTTDDKAFEIKLYAKASNGYKVGDVDDLELTSQDAFDSLSGATGTAFYIEVIDKDGKLYDIDNSRQNQFFKMGTETDGTAVLKVLPVVVSDSAFVKLPTGTYQVKVTKVDTAKLSAAPATITGASLTTVAMTSIVVTDTQVAGSAQTKNTKVSSVADFLSSEDNVVIKLGDYKVNGNLTVTAGETVGNNNPSNIFLKTVKVNVPVNYKLNGTETEHPFVQEVTVGASLILN